MYLLVEDIEQVKSCLGKHVNYWKSLPLESYTNGPFADKTGGLIIFSAEGLDTAERIVESDPLITENGVQQYWLKEWIA